MWVLCILTVGAIGLAQLPEGPSGSEPGLHQVPLAGAAEGLSANLSRGAQTDRGHAGADVEVEAPGTPPAGTEVGGVGQRAAFTFTPPLWQVDQEEVWRFRGTDGMPRTDVQVRVDWHTGDGHPAPLPPADPPAWLWVQVEDRSGQRLAPTANGTSWAVFEVPAERLAGAASAWSTLRFEVPGHGGGTTHYSSAGSSGTDGLQGTRVWWVDSDQDGAPEDTDNCPEVPDRAQKDNDDDLVGDVCDADDDNDGFRDTTESEMGSDPLDPRSTPQDRDADGYPDDQEVLARSDPADPASTPLDPDADQVTTTQETQAGSDPYDPRSTPFDLDADGIENERDLCPHDADSTQGDADRDGIGDACDQHPADGPDGDQDGDGIENRVDVCPSVHDDQSDLDGDGQGDACDTDRDGDGHADVQDDLPQDASEWRDTDGDGQGDEADTDDDNDGLPDGLELALGSDPREKDSDGDGLTDWTEHQAGQGIADAMAPDRRAKGLQAKVQDDGSVRLDWRTGPGTGHVDAFWVWRTADDEMTRVAQVAPATEDLHGAATWVAIDGGHDGEDAVYTVVPGGAGMRPSPGEATVTSAAVWAEDVPAFFAAREESQDRPAPREAQPAPPAMPPTAQPTGQDAPFAPVALFASLLAALATALRRHAKA